MDNSLRIRQNCDLNTPTCPDVLFALRDLEVTPGLAMVERPLSTAKVRPSRQWRRPSTRSTSSSITAGCSSKLSSTLSTPCSSSSTTDPRLVLIHLTRHSYRAAPLHLSTSSTINTRGTAPRPLRDTRYYMGD